MITVAGCVAQAEGAEISARAPVVDLVIGPQSYHRLPELLNEAQTQSKRLVETSFPEEEKFDQLPNRAEAQALLEKAARTKDGMASVKLPRRPPSAFLTVQEGCDKFCTFCVVPYTRGMEYSRSVEKLAAEAASLSERGVREVTLLGQNVNAYHGEGPDGRDWSLAKLINRIADVKGIERIRYTTSHPRDMADDLYAAHRDQPKLMPYLHLPFQAGSDRILAAMNRKHTADDYRKIIDRLRSARNDMALSTDIIVGFPGETDQEFRQTIELVEEITFAQAFSFKYSARPGTPAAKIEEHVPEDVKTARLHELQALLFKQQTEFNRSCVGRTFSILLEKPGRFDGQLVGRSPYLQPVHVKAPSDLIGRIVDVEIEAATQNSLSARLVTDA
ncbi:MAG: tRNA (N6-isopentenyl adenosine(37)-C2)-methylthiotransferase MiaB, partial [Pseudomonadota bacterium]